MNEIGEGAGIFGTVCLAFAPYVEALGLARGAAVFGIVGGVSAGVGAGISYANDWNPAVGAWNGFQIGTAIGGLSPRTAATSIGLGSVAATEGAVANIGGSLSREFTLSGVKNAVSVPSTAVAEVGEEFGPWIGRSQYRTTAEFSDAVFQRYQQFYDQADAIVQQRVAAGTICNDPKVVGGVTDTIARGYLRAWLRNAEGIQEGPGNIIQVNRWLRDPSSSAYRIPDVSIPGNNIIFDGTLATSPPKSALWPQISDFNTFSGGSNVIIVQPTRLGGSYGVVFPR